MNDAMCVSVSESNFIIDHDLDSNCLRTVSSIKRIYLPSLQTQASLRAKNEIHLMISLLLFVSLPFLSNTVNASYRTCQSQSIH